MALGVSRMRKAHGQKSADRGYELNCDGDITDEKRPRPKRRGPWLPALRSAHAVGEAGSNGLEMLEVQGVNVAAGQALFGSLAKGGEILPFAKGDKRQPLADLFDKQGRLFGRNQGHYR